MVPAGRALMSSIRNGRPDSAVDADHVAGVAGPVIVSSDATSTQLYG